MSSEAEGKNGQTSGRPPLRLLLSWLLILLLPLLLFTSQVRQSDPAEVAYSVFRDQVAVGNVLRVEVQGGVIVGELESAITVLSASDPTVSAETRDFKTFVPSFGDDGLLEELRRTGVEIRTLAEPGESGWLTVLLSFLPLLLLIAIGIMIARRMQQNQGGLFSFGRSRAQLYSRTAESLTFADVAGAEAAKDELRELIDFLKTPDRFHALGGKVPKGVLLVGPPGTGKTLMARAVAGEANVPFFSITGSDFMEMLVGVGAARVRDLFKEAKAAAPSIVFIDELDSIGRTRGAGIGGGHDEREQTLNQLLSELDGFEPSESVIVMAATNRPDILDSALTRAGRFDRHVVIDLPTAADRLAILEVHAREKPLAPDADLQRLARGTPGLSGADLENILNEAALSAARAGQTTIGPADLESASDRVLLGLARKGLALSDEERELLASHEAGHAVVAAVLPSADPVHKVTIIPRGRSMGATQQFQERERYLYRREELLDRIAVMLGGRAAEQLVFDTRTTGAEDDLKRATQLARHMVLRWGMSDALGPMATGRNEAIFLGEEMARRREFSEETARQIDNEVGLILESAELLARDTLATHRPQLDAIAARLLEREEIAGDEVLALMGQGSRPRSDAQARASASSRPDRSDAAREPVST